MLVILIIANKSVKIILIEFEDFCEEIAYVCAS